MGLGEQLEGSSEIFAPGFIGMKLMKFLGAADAEVGIGTVVPPAYPKLVEVGVCGVESFVVGLEEDVNDFLLLLRQLGLQALLQRFLLFALQDHLTLPLHLLIRQDDCRDGRKEQRVTNRHWETKVPQVCCSIPQRC